MLMKQVIYWDWKMGIILIQTKLSLVIKEMK